MNIYPKLFANFYDGFMQGFEKKLFKKRKKLLSNLEGNVLGVGEGTGVNFKFYPDYVKVFSVEPSVHMLKKAKLKAAGKENIIFYNYGINDKELDNQLEKQSMDAIVCTLVLCTITDPVLALENFKKWLKPNGKLIVMEHIHASKPLNRAFQNIINPAWKLIGDGCHLNRNTDVLIKQAGFTPVYEEYFKRTLKFHSGIFKLNKF
jgi:SAM-dependent methyltransferase